MGTEEEAERARRRTVKRRNIIVLVILSGFAAAVFTVTFFHIPQEGRSASRALGEVQSQ